MKTRFIGVSCGLAAVLVLVFLLSAQDVTTLKITTG